MRRILCMLLILTAMPMAHVDAQDILEIRNAGLDQLVAFLRREVNPRTYYVKDPAEQSFYTVTAPREGFLEAAVAELESKGHTIIRHDGALFILHGKSIYQGLPAGYFDSGSSLGPKDDGLQKFLADQNAIVTFQNKIYEIGDRNAGRTGKVAVSGHVRDISSGEPLAGVSVYNQESGVYTVTDGAGFYRVMLPTGSSKLSFSGYSLEDMQLNLKVFDNGGLDVVMKEKVTSLAGAVVSADMISRHRDASMGLEKIRVSTIAKIPTALGEPDILKAVLTLPGVKTVGEASSGFNVRGGSSDQNLILMNDGTIYNPSHMFGIFSAFNPDVFNDVELYKSTIPAEYGGRISSVLEVHGREGNSNKLTGALGLGLLTSRLLLEGPVAKGRTSFILGARTTYSNWILKAIPEKISRYHGGVANFSDINANISHKINGRNSLHAYAYWSTDNFTFQHDTTFHYSNLNASLKWRSNFSANHNMVVAAGYDQYSGGFDHKSMFNPYSAYSVRIGIRQAFAKATFHSTISDRHKLTYGTSATYYMINPGRLAPLTGTSHVTPAELDLDKGLEPALFLSDAWTVNNRLMIDAGMRFSGFMSGNDGKMYGTPEVRLSGKYSLRDDLSVKASFNSLAQYIHLISNSTSISPIDTWRLSNSKLRPQTGWQAAAGAYWTLADGKAEISAEGYYKRMSHTLDYKSGSILLMNPALEDALVETYGKSYGLEIMARKTVGKFTGWLSYTYSRARLREMKDRGIETINEGSWYNAPHDKPHDFKFTGNYKFTHRLSLSMNTDYSTGRPITLPVGVFMYGNGYRPAYSDRNTYRIPDYFRVDVALNIEPSHYLRQLTHMSFTFGVYNLTGRKNAYSVFFDSGSGGKMLSVFACPVPYANLNLKF